MFLLYEELHFMKEAIYLNIMYCLIFRIQITKRVSAFLPQETFLEYCFGREKKTVGCCGYNSLINCARDLAAQQLKTVACNSNNLRYLWKSRWKKCQTLPMNFTIIQAAIANTHKCNGLLRKLKARMRLSLIT